jgi:hypothetical protein
VEKRDHKRAQRAEARYQWGNDKRGEHGTIPSYCVRSVLLTLSCRKFPKALQRSSTAVAWLSRYIVHVHLLIPMLPVGVLV